jgi:hypothetical protein
VRGRTRLPPFHEVNRLFSLSCVSTGALSDSRVSVDDSSLMTSAHIGRYGLDLAEISASTSYAVDFGDLSWFGVS